MRIDLVREVRHTRRHERVPVALPGRYLLLREMDGPWSDCRLVDIAPGGWGLELFGVWPDEHRDETLLVELGASRAQQLPISMLGSVKHRHVTESGTLRVGIELLIVDSDTEAALRLRL